MLDTVDAHPMMLNNPYGVELGVSNMILQAASQEGIYVDKVVALALRPGRIKFRDVWDLHWLQEHNTSLRLPLIFPKLEAHGQEISTFQMSLKTRLDSLAASAELQKEVLRELPRFMLNDQISGVMDQPDFWRYVCSELKRELTPVLPVPNTWLKQIICSINHGSSEMGCNGDHDQQDKEHDSVEGRSRILMTASAYQKS